MTREAACQRGLDLRHRGHGRQQLAQAGDTSSHGVELLVLELLHWDAQGTQHGIDVELHQQGSLKQQGSLYIVSSRNGYIVTSFVAIIARAKLRWRSEAPE